MALRIVQLGSPRSAREGTRIGTVRRPPRGVPKSQFSARDFYDVWYPELAPSVETLKLGQQAQTPAEWAAFVKAYRALGSFRGDSAFYTWLYRIAVNTANAPCMPALIAQSFCGLSAKRAPLAPPRRAVAGRQRLRPAARRGRAACCRPDRWAVAGGPA